MDSGRVDLSERGAAEQKSDADAYWVTFLVINNRHFFPFWLIGGKDNSRLRKLTTNAGRPPSTPTQETTHCMEVSLQPKQLNNSTKKCSF